MNAFEVVERALELTRARQRAMPEYGLFASVVTQLEYLLTVLSGSESDRSRLRDIIVGHFAVRELEDSDPELANALIDAQFVASKMSKGLKIDLT